MASEVDICNEALSHIGESATVSSIDPPEGSVHARHCARFYPMARDELLARHPFYFNTVRSTPALITSPLTEWLYAYAIPSNTLKVLAVLPYETTDPLGGVRDVNSYQTTPIPFQRETMENGTQVVYTNEENARIKRTVRVTDTNVFSEEFRVALAHKLASKLAGPIIKGKAGREVAEAQLQLSEIHFAIATGASANQQSVRAASVPSGIASRS